jgi:predicted permease
LVKQPGFTLIAVTTLALGIGANTTIFSFTNALLLRSIAGVADQGKLVMIGRTMNGSGFDTFSWPNYADLRDQNKTLAGLAAYYSTAMHLSTAGEADRVRGAAATGSYFSVLGVGAQLGRTLLMEDEAAPGASPVAVISDSLWRRRFDADPEIVGKTMLLNNHQYTIVGVAAESFAGTRIGDTLDVWVPVTMYAQVEPTVWNGADQIMTVRNASWLDVFARLKPGVEIEQARSELGAIARQLEEAYPKFNRQAGVAIAPGLGFESPNTRADVRRFMSLMMGIVGLVLVVACANVANMLLARATVRRREIAIRLALGAGRWRIVRQLLTESLLLALLGGVTGVLVALWANNLLKRFLPPRYMGVPLDVQINLDPRVLGFALFISLLTGVIFGLIPALNTSKPELVPLLKDAVVSGRGVRQSKLRGALVVSQVALSLVVLVCAGLFVRTLRNSRAISPGFDIERVLTLRVDVGRQGYTEPQGKVYYWRLLERVKALPGVESASLVSTLPLSGGSWGTGIRVEGKQLTPDGEPLSTDYNVIAPHYFETIRIRLLLGRDFVEQDSATSPGVVIVNETTAHRLWADENPLGQRLAMGPDQKRLEVIGVVSDVKHRSLFESPRTHLYLPIDQAYKSTMTLLVRTLSDPKNLVAAVQRETQSIDKNLPVFSVRTLEEQLDNSLGPQRVSALFVSAFGVIALLLAAIGLYGVMAYAVSQRTREIGIRLALGASNSDVFRSVLKTGLGLTMMGLVIGLAACLAVTRVLTSQLYGVNGTDPLTFACVAGLLASVAVLACYIPARRATKVDPMIALRSE